jgi:hypothetical protein
VLVPFIGTQRTFLAFAFAVALTAALALPRRHLTVPVAITALLALPPGTTKRRMAHGCSKSASGTAVCARHRVA